MAAAIPLIRNELIPKILVVSKLPGIHGNSNVLTGGGTNDTAVIQAALDELAAQGGGELLVDRACLVTGLTYSTGTTIRGFQNTGFFLAAGSNCPVLRNKNISATAGTYGDHDLKLLGGTYNLNLPNQIHGPSGDYFLHIVAHYGVENVEVDGVTLRTNSSSNTVFMGYSLAFSNWSNVQVSNVAIWVGTAPGRDGIHFFGGGSKATIKNCWGQTGSDFIALNSTDYLESYVQAWPASQGTTAWVLNSGDISHVSIDGITLHNSANGVGLLSADKNITNISIRNVRGTARDYAMSLWNAWPTSGGYIDSVVVDNIDVTVAGSSYGRYPIWIGGLSYFDIGLDEYVSCLVHVRSVQFSNVRWTIGVSEEADEWLRIDSLATVDNIEVRGVVLNEPTANANAEDMVFIRNYGIVSNLLIDDVIWNRPSDATPYGYVLHSGPDATLGNAVVGRKIAPRILGGVHSESSGSVITNDGTSDPEHVIEDEYGNKIYWSMPLQTPTAKRVQILLDGAEIYSNTMIMFPMPFITEPKVTWSGGVQVTATTTGCTVGELNGETDIIVIEGR